MGGVAFVKNAIRSKSKASNHQREQICRTANIGYRTAPGQAGSDCVTIFSAIS
jgi:hypothetical protein